MFSIFYMAPLWHISFKCHTPVCRPCYMKQAILHIHLSDFNRHFKNKVTSTNPLMASVCVPSRNGYVGMWNWEMQQALMWSLYCSYVITTCLPSWNSRTHSSNMSSHDWVKAHFSRVLMLFSKKFSILFEMSETGWDDTLL